MYSAGNEIIIKPGTYENITKRFIPSETFEENVQYSL